MIVWEMKHASNIPCPTSGKSHCVFLYVSLDTSALSPFCMKMLPFYAQQAAPDVKVKNLRLKKGAAL